MHPVPEMWQLAMAGPLVQSVIFFAYSNKL